MKAYAATLFFAVLAVTVTAVDPDSASKRAEAMKLLHYTRQVGQFRDDIKLTLEKIRSQNPGVSLSYWDETEREVSSDSYAQWIVGLFMQDLTDAELAQLNAVFSNSDKKKLLDELLLKLKDKKDADLVRAVQEYRKEHDPQVAEELIAFMQSEAARSYASVLREISDGRDEIMMRLLREADGRMRARHRQG